MEHTRSLRSILFSFAAIGLAACSAPERNPKRVPIPPAAPVAAAPAAPVAAPVQPVVATPAVAPVVVAQAAGSAQAPEPSRYSREHYDKREARIPMRDGAKLFTSIYTPKDLSQKYPILMMRTPYSVGPYGEDKYKDTLGPSDLEMKDGFIVVYQDVRGCYMSEGDFVDVRPHMDTKSGPKDVDESTDAFDTIEWLLANVQNHNGKVGMWGISYPGFYAAASMIDHHPALAAVSPQAPIADWFFDDFHHHGTLFLPHAFNFLSGFGQPRPSPTTERNRGFQHPTPDGYDFFLRLGPLSNVDEKYFHKGIRFWEDLVAHPNYDAFWEARNLQPHLKRVAPAVMTVGGWFDAEDLFGALHVYSAVEQQNPGIFNVLVMGPWQHGGWSRSDGDKLGIARFGDKTSFYYREKIELAFFDRFLKGRGGSDLAEANVFETGANRWRTFDRWPPSGLVQRSLFLGEGRTLSFDAPAAVDPASDGFVSDPNQPVPYTEAITTGMTREYMTDDQRFAARRPDVLAYRTEPLAENLTLAGPLKADLWVSTSGTDSDWIVKLIDVFPDDAPTPDDYPAGKALGGCEMMVRSEAIRGRFRESYAQPKPFVPGEPTLVPLVLQDVLHTFQKGHRIMVQIQCTWFPLVDRNPQTYVDNVFEAKPEDFVPASQKVFRSAQHPTRIEVGELPL